MANLGYLPPYPAADKCGGLPNPETTDKLASGLRTWDQAVLEQRTEERNDLATKLVTANRQIERAQNALRKIALGHPCDLHDLIAKDAMRDMKFIAAGQTPPPATPRNGGVCELNAAEVRTATSHTDLCRRGLDPRDAGVATGPQLPTRTAGA